MKRLAIQIFIGILAIRVTEAATRYIDPGCTTNGNGTTTSCGTNGPFNTLAAGRAAMVAGDHLVLRGIHSPHSGCPNGWDVYRERPFMDFSGMLFASETFVEAYNWTAIGARTEELVIQEGTSGPVTWTQCSNCHTGGNCPGVNNSANGAACTDVWKTSTSVGEMARTAQGSPTYRVTSINDLSNAHAGYTAGRCSTTGWKPCVTNTDCLPSDGTCTAGAAPERDAYTNGSTLYVRWGTLPSPAPGIADPIAQGGIDVFNSSHLTIRGLVVRNVPHAGIIVQSPNNDIKVIDNRVFFTLTGAATYSNETWGILLDNRSSFAPWSNSIVFNSNEIAFTHSDAVHIQSNPDTSAVNAEVSDNYIHDIENRNVVGTYAGGTPQGIVITDDNWGTCSGAGHSNFPCHNVSASDTCQCGCPTGDVCVSGGGNFTGSTVAGNIIDLRRFVGGTDQSVGIRMVNNVSGLTVRDNLVLGAPGRGSYFDCSFRKNTGINFYNNVISGSGTTGIDLKATSPCSTTFNNIWDNTLSGSGSFELTASDATGTISGNVFGNNIFHKSSAAQVISFSPDEEFVNNLVYSTDGGTIATLCGGTYTCANINTLQTGNMCSDPIFESAGTFDYHIQAWSPAKDRGTATGMPLPHTASINNLITSARGLPQYADNVPLTDGAWDIGATEIRVVDPGFESGAFEIGKWGQYDLDCNVGSGGIVVGNAHSGTHSASMLGKQIGPTCGGVFQTLSGLSTTHTYSVYGYWMSTSVSTGRPLRVAQNGIPICTLTSSASGWKKFTPDNSCTFTPTNSTIDLQFYVLNPPSGTVTVNIDDIDVH
jgi:hypothetical protein